MLLTITATSSNPSAPAGREYSFENFPVVIGRSDSCDLTLPDDNKYVSSRHAEVVLSGNDLLITDTSANGTFINNASAPVGRGNQTRLKNGDCVSMGEFALQINFQPSETTPAPQSDDPFAEISHSTDVAGNADDPFAGLEDISTDRNTGPGRDDHNDRLEDKGIGPSAWESGTVDDPFTSSVPQQVKSDAKQQSPASQQTRANNTDDDDWAGWVGSIPSNPIPVQASGSASASAAKSPFNADESTPDHALDVLLQAAGLNPAEFSGIDQKVLGEHIGGILKKSTLSMMLLLRSRDEIKNAMRADVTLLGAQGNSPLQFSITAEDALRKLLTPSAASGFSDANNALDKGLQDIKIHQLAMLEAMRSALQVALSHFDPEILEKNTRDANPLASSLPLAREAKLWEQFQDRYNEIKRETVDDFSDLFGRELRRAYEKSVDELKRSSD